MFLENVKPKSCIRTPNRLLNPSHVTDILCLLFADDVTHVAETASKLQVQLNVLNDFCVSSGMKVNLKKTEIIVFRNGGRLRLYENWSLDGNLVKTTSYYKYIGLLFTPRLSWSSANIKTCSSG